jgi:HD-like signal output (HDOD) protein
MNQPSLADNELHAPVPGEFNPLLIQCLKDMQARNVMLPTLPDISLQIRKAINDEKANNARIARVVQMDPAITGRLVQIANSPLYLGRKKIESCPEALTRVGLRSAQHFITSFALKSVFQAKLPYVRKRMQELWAHSSYVAAICAVLAHKTRGFDPDRAMLAGLIHDIGVVPILTCADRHPELAQNVKHIDQAIEELRADMGVMVIKAWNFPEDFEDIVVNAENWNRSGAGDADYTDLVILSQLHSFVGTLHIHKCPPLDEVPAYRKLLGGHLDADTSRNVLELAKEEIRQIQNMLTH